MGSEVSPHRKRKTSTHTHSLTVDVVVDISSVVLQSELIASHHLPGFGIGQLVTAGKRKGAVSWIQNQLPITAEMFIHSHRFFLVSLSVF